MAYTKIHAITATVAKAVDYICNPDKTEENILISSYGCSPQTAAFDFRFTLSKTKQSDKNKAYHLIQSFAPGEVSYEEAHQIGKELAETFLGNKYSYLVTTHIDKKHIHNHILFCATDHIEYKKYHDCKQSYYHIRKLSDELCRKHHLSVIPDSKETGTSYKEWMEHQKNHSWKSQLKTDINTSIKQAFNYEEFLLLMKQKGYEIESANSDSTGKYIRFRAAGQKRFIRGKETTLGKEFTRERIQERIEQKAQEHTNKLLKKKSIRNLIDTSFDKKYENNIGLQTWAAKQNLKLAAQTYAALNSKGFQTIEELKTHHALLLEQSISYRQNLLELEKKLRDHALILKYTEQYKENQPYYLKYSKAKNKEIVFRNYESQLLLYDGAKNGLKRMGLHPTKINQEEVRKEYQKLIQMQSVLSKKYKNIEQERKELQHLEDILTQYRKMPDKQLLKQKEQDLQDL